MTDAASHPHSLADGLAWLDGWINYERTGPQPAQNPRAVHDPEVRLRTMQRLLVLMGEPQRSYPSIHITGTNGKTSTARLVTALLSAQGLRVGTYTSPHLECLNERILLDGEALDGTALAAVLADLRLHEPMLGDIRPSYFEWMTAGALLTFANEAVDVAVIEVGVGGTWDATNVIEAEVAVITNVGIDHTNYLGPTRREIAGHKAGIVQAGATVIVGEQDQLLDTVIADRQPGRVLVAGPDFAAAGNRLAVGGRQLDLRTPWGHHDEVFLSLHGRHQGTNAAVALAATEAFFDRGLAGDVVREAFGGASSPGRMEVVRRQPLCIIDGAHNSEGAIALADALDEEFATTEGRILVLGTLAPHQPLELLTALRAEAYRLVIACTAPSPRAVPGREIAAAAAELSVPAAVVDDVGAAVREALAAALDDELVLVTGSLYVAGAARTALLGSYRGPPEP